GPTNLAVTTAEPSGVSLSWSPSASGDPTSYSVYRGTMSDGENVAPIGTTAGSSTSYTDMGVEVGIPYFYAVAATNGVGVSPSSNEVSVTLSAQAREAAAR